MSASARERPRWLNSMHPLSLLRLGGWSACTRVQDLEGGPRKMAPGPGNCKHCDQLLSVEDVSELSVTINNGRDGIER